MGRRDPMAGLFLALSLPLILLVLLPLGNMICRPSLAMMVETIRDPEVVAAIGRSLGFSLTAGGLALVLGTPLAYLLSRKNFWGKRFIEGIMDLPIMIPHPVVGIALLSLAGRNHPLGRALGRLGVEIMGTGTGIVCALLFVGLPFFVGTAKAGFDTVPLRLEKASRTLGAGTLSTFFRITFPLTWRHLVLGLVMCTARGISEFGAIVIVAYHPMTAPVLIYERFTAYGLKYSQPVAVWLIFISLMLFLVLRMLSRGTSPVRS